MQRKIRNCFHWGREVPATVELPHIICRPFRPATEATRVQSQTPTRREILLPKKVTRKILPNRVIPPTLNRTRRTLVFLRVEGSSESDLVVFRRRPWLGMCPSNGSDRRGAQDAAGTAAKRCARASRAAAHRHRDEALVVDKAGPVPALGREKRKFDQLIGSHRASNSGFNGLYVQAPGTG